MNYSYWTFELPHVLPVFVGFLLLRLSNCAIMPQRRIYLNCAVPVLLALELNNLA